MPTCSFCSSKVSIFRLHAHQRSAACKLYRRTRAALADLRAVGGYVAYGSLPVLRLVQNGKLARARQQLACAVDDLGHMTVVDMDGRVRQLLHGEWAHGDHPERYMLEGGA